MKNEILLTKLTKADPYVLEALTHAFSSVENVELVQTIGGTEIYLRALDNRTQAELTALALDTLVHTLTRVYTV